MSQLRSDLVKSLRAAEDRLKAYNPGEPDLSKAIQQWIDSFARFLEPDPDLTEGYRHLRKSIELLEKIGDLGASIEKQSIATARAHALSALEALKTTIFQVGRASKAADRVGLGEYGKPI